MVTFTLFSLWWEELRKLSPADGHHALTLQQLYLQALLPSLFYRSIFVAI